MADFLFSNNYDFLVLLSEKIAIRAGATMPQVIMRLTQLETPKKEVEIREDEGRGLKIWVFSSC